jgi:phi13 family phage major tail protein
MAKIGLKYPVYKSATNQGVIAKAIQADIAITTNNVTLYADDAVDEVDKSFQTGTLTLGINDLSSTIQAEFLGHKVDEDTGEITANKDDESPFVGIGFYGVKKVNKVKKYRAIWLTKVQFSEPSDNHATKGESVAFATPVLEGTIMRDDNGDWKKENTFVTEAEARAYLEAKAGISPICSMPVASLASGNYTGTQSVTLTAGAEETIYYTTNGTTPSATNGTAYTDAISIEETCALRAVSTRAGYNNSPVASYEYIITA